MILAQQTNRAPMIKLTIIGLDLESITLAINTYIKLIADFINSIVIIPKFNELIFFKKDSC